MWVHGWLFINICIDFTSNLRLSKDRGWGGGWSSGVHPLRIPSGESQALSDRKLGT